MPAHPPQKMAWRRRIEVVALGVHLLQTSPRGRADFFGGIQRNRALYAHRNLMLAA